MKTLTKQSMTLLILMLFSIMLSGQELKKEFNESFDVNANASVELQNKFGNIQIETWNKNQVTINVIVSVDAKSEKESQRILDNINVTINGSNTSVKAITKMNGKADCKNCEFSIDYFVKMPATGMLNVQNEFGNTYVGDLDGKAKVTVKYGNLEMGDLRADKNDINVAFGDAEFDIVTAAEVHLEYGSIEIGKSGHLNMLSRFSSVEIGEVSEINLDSQYDGLEIGSVDIMTGDASFSSIEVGEVFDKINIRSSYGGIEIDRVSGGFSSVYIDTEFGGVDLGISSSASYKLNATANSGDIDFPESNADITSLVHESFKKEIEAFVGKDKSSASTVTIKAKNCDVEIK